MTLPAFSVSRDGDFTNLKVTGDSLIEGDLNYFKPQIVVDSQDTNITNTLTLIRTTGAAAGALADGEHIGQIKIIFMLVDGGNYVLTPANLTGGTTLTFGDAGDTITLVWTGVGTSGGGWQVVTNTGVVVA